MRITRGPVTSVVTGLAAALALAGCASGAAAAHSHPAAIVTVTRTVKVPGPVRTVIRYRHHHHHPAAVPTASPAPAVPALGCKILSNGGAEQFAMTTVGGGTYSGIIYVSFYDYAGSGDVFTGTTVDGASPLANWQPVPAADIGGSAEPTGCTASAG